MNRIMVIGQPAAGKSTFARALGARTGLPVVHIDQIYWMPGWTERPRAQAIAMVEEAQAREQWIFEGNNTSTWPGRVARADLIIWLDLPVWQRYWRLARRIAGSYGRTRPDMAPDCPERISLEFIIYIWRTRQTWRRKAAALFAAEPSAAQRVHLRSQAEMDAYLEGWR
ncbi:MAG: AAA family ATPase [Pseudomonadota bacterium]